MPISVTIQCFDSHHDSGPSSSILPAIIGHRLVSHPHTNECWPHVNQKRRQIHSTGPVNKKRRIHVEPSRAMSFPALQASVKLHSATPAIPRVSPVSIELDSDGDELFLAKVHNYARLYF